MTNQKRYNEIENMASEMGYDIKFGGYTQSARGNETLYKVMYGNTLFKKGTIKQVKQFLIYIS